MSELSFIVLVLGLLFYVLEWSDANPSWARACVFAAAVLQSVLSFALRA